MAGDDDLKTPEASVAGNAASLSDFAGMLKTCRSKEQDCKGEGSRNGIRIQKSLRQ